jgi:hypothetical protein
MRFALACLLLVACAEGGGTSGKTDASIDAYLELPDTGADDGGEDGGLDDGGGEDVVVVELDGGDDAGLDAGELDGGVDGGIDGGVDAGDRCLGVDCSGMDGPCVIGVCAPSTGTCTTTPRVDGTSCDVDATDCVTSACMAGVCRNTNLAECSACATGVCSADGTCGAEPTTRLLEGFESGTFAAGWTPGGSSGWIVTSGDRNSGTFSAQSGSIGNSQTSSLTVSITAPVATGLGFHSRTSTESNFDWLEVWVDGTRRDRWSGTTAWTERVIAVAAGAHTVEWRYTKDGSGASGLDTVWIDDVRFRPTPATEGGFESSLAPFTSSSPAWVRVTSGQRTGTGAARGADVSDGQTTSMSTTFTLDATRTISLWYRVSSEANYDYFRILVDGTQQAQFSGTVAWTQWTMSLGAGSHTLELRYVKDGSVSSGEDNAWVDDVDLAWPAASTGLCPD